MKTESNTLESSAAAQATRVVQPYLNFDGRCEEALDFYEKTLGAVTDCKMRFQDAPDGECCAPGNESKIMHAQFRIGQSALFASDCSCAGEAKISGISLSLTLATAAECDALFEALAEGGEVQMPLGSPFFAERFGVVADKFGVSWMLIAGAKGES